MRRRSFLIAAGAGALLIVALIVLIGRAGSDSAGSIDKRDLRPFYEDGSRGFPSPRTLEKLIVKGPSPAALLAAYQRYSRYPPHSRPLKATMKDLVNPWQIESIALPILGDQNMRTERALRKWIAAQKQAGKSSEDIRADLKRRARQSPRFRFKLNRHTITEGARLVAELEVTDSRGQPLRYHVSSARIIGDIHFGRKGLGSPTFNDNGTDQDRKSGDGVFTFSWKAPSKAKLYWGNLTLEASIRVPGPGQVKLQQSFYSSPRAPARFTGRFRERLEDGSLVIAAELEVFRECRFSLHANLFSESLKEYAHWAAADETLAVGVHYVPFLFYGKVFRDGGYAGRFTMRDLRGTCENLPFPARWLRDPSKRVQIQTAKPKQEPLLLFVPYTTAVHRTREYTREQFSQREWTSQRKTRRLNRLRRMIQ